MRWTSVVTQMTLPNHGNLLVRLAYVVTYEKSYSASVGRPVSRFLSQDLMATNTVPNTVVGIRYCNILKIQKTYRPP